MINWDQLIVGTKNILEETKDLIHMEVKWTKRLIKDMQMIECKIHLENMDPATPLQK